METKEQSKIQKLMKSKPAKAGVSVALVGTLALAGIGAYFTGTDTVENKFDISAGLTDKITVVEENWDTTDADDNGIPDAAEHVVPLQTLAKDPVVKNESDVEAWLFCQIKVPTANVSVVGEDGTPEAAASHELFTYTVNEGWTETGTPVVADGYTTHTYLYNTKVAANSQTAKAVFDDVTLINLVEAQGVAGPDQIDVIGHGIQAEGLDTAAAAWTAWAFTSQGSAEATVKTSKVGIELAEVAPQPDRLLVTGSLVETDTSVTNTGEDAWIRCRVDYSVDGGMMGKAQWTGGEAVDCEGWMLAEDGWWHSTEPVESGSTLPFETTITFPVFEQVAEGDAYVWEPVTGEIDNAKWKKPSPDPDDDAALMTYCGAEGSVLTETVTAHAVQAKNFEPDFDAASPWGDVEVEGTDVSASKEAR